jgi:hypothetical protein
MRPGRFIDRQNHRRFDADWAGDVFVWDIDKTYLDTRFSSLRGLLAIPFEFAVDKRAIAGAVPILRALRTGPNIASPRFSPLYFVSGSPPTLRGVVERKMLLDGVQQDGITFKDQMGLLKAGRPRAIKEQVGYKLAALLMLRRELPAAVRFTLFGDDVESDMDVFLLFGAVLAGLRGAALREVMRHHGSAWPEVEQAVTLSADLAVEADPVDAVFILCSKEGLLARPDLDPRVRATRSFLQTALVLRAQGKVDVDCPARVVADLERLHTPPTLIQQWLDDAAARFDVDVSVTS